MSLSISTSTSTAAQPARSSPAATANSRITPKMLQALAPLPDTALRLLAMLDDAEVPLREIAGVAMRDLGLSATMLRMANSPLFAMRGRVATVGDALRVIGTAQARLLVLASGVSQAAQRELPHYGLAAGALMRHSDLVANVAMCVAYETRLAAVGTAYSAGLLHDIGKIVINGLVQAPTGAGGAGSGTPLLEQEMRRRGCSLLEAEEVLCGSNHAQVGRQLAELWSLPADLADAMATHHTDIAEGQEVTLGWCVAMANGIAGTLDAGYPTSNRAPMAGLRAGLDVDKVVASVSRE